MGDRSAIAQGSGGDLDGLDDIDVAGTPAQISLQGTLDCLVVWGGVVPQQASAGHDHARRTVAALQPVLLAKSGLQRMQFPGSRGQALHRHHL